MSIVDGNHVSCLFVWFGTGLRIPDKVSHINYLIKRKFYGKPSGPVCILCISTRLAVCPVLPLMVLHCLRAAVVSSTESVHHLRSQFAVSSTELESSDASLPVPIHKHTLCYSTNGYDGKYCFCF